jgi:GntR family negative regulator for fad regulon and positive regulator of fabA
LRETQKRLASEGWIRIRHGKPTVVNDYWNQGGLSLLSTLAKYGEYLPNGFITHLLQVRLTMLPTAARLAACHAPEALLEYLDRAKSLDENPEEFAEYDWELQLLIVRHSWNPIFTLIFNDFTAVFKTMAVRYFKFQEAKDASRAYYMELSRAIEQGGEDVEQIVSSVMERVIGLWSELKCSVEVK